MYVKELTCKALTCKAQRDARRLQPNGERRVLDWSCAFFAACYTEDGNTRSLYKSPHTDTVIYRVVRARASHRVFSDFQHASNPILRVQARRGSPMVITKQN
ncbi:hypothetical protein KP509_18G003800 [Ceratopteris richardii]|uniref:Uncharacterized protein n=1 Tax=Ceratopteris richardii TaxID=49495 RepID=A0A8T2SM20_CERRI|nr:hypothetical protein KP509_18G003800 [Ceratopteris richardii]